MCSCGLSGAATGAAALAALPEQVVGLGCGLLAAILKLAHKKLGLKAKKHDRVFATAQSSERTCERLMSTALSDGHLSEEQFAEILAEMGAYQHAKKGIREADAAKASSVSPDDS